MVYDNGLMIGMNAMKGSEVHMQIGNEILFAIVRGSPAAPASEMGRGVFFGFDY
jgi:hypothetical protein